MMRTVSVALAIAGACFGLVACGDGSSGVGGLTNPLASSRVLDLDTINSGNPDPGSECPAPDELLSGPVTMDQINEAAAEFNACLDTAYDNLTVKGHVTVTAIGEPGGYGKSIVEGYRVLSVARPSFDSIYGLYCPLSLSGCSSVSLGDDIYIVAKYERTDIATGGYVWMGKIHTIEQQ